ncbi:hypothetical protein [Paenibacillus alba]|uniref:Uncharacterized protein n=1 Tax=Paenibacillus alba TaxID=1197127 RepID=A0ABU6G4V2_9BACL|nr:hypothetical protein [Paenibacillus alba]MEC0229206.1 hypothetical protein [Paenibacillus alba]
MWEQVLLTDQLQLQMDPTQRVLELKLNQQEEAEAGRIRLSHAELTLLLHSLLEVSRKFRGD